MSGASTVGSSYMRASINNGASNYDVDSIQNVSHQNIFAVMTYNGTYLTLYVNGTVQSTISVTNNLQQNVYDFTIGHILGGDATDDEYVSEVWILNNTINSTDVSSIYNGAGVISCKSEPVVESGIKSGSVTVTEDTCQAVSFNTSFGSMPVAVGNVQSGAKDNVVSIGSLSASGFNICLSKVGAGSPASNYTVYWIATNFGNP